jgi:hypothetical protein
MLNNLAKKFDLSLHLPNAHAANTRNTQFAYTIAKLKRMTI